MKHIKLFEDYSDEEILDLAGDLRGIGHHDLKFNIDLNFGYESDSYWKNLAEEERSYAENYLENGIFITSVEGDMRKNYHAKFDIKLSNGDQIMFEDPKYDSPPKLHFKGIGFNANENYGDSWSDFSIDEPDTTYMESLMKFYKLIKKK